jgi:hypothetical protein
MNAALAKTPNPSSGAGRKVKSFCRLISIPWICPGSELATVSSKKWS